MSEDLDDEAEDASQIETTGGAAGQAVGTAPRSANYWASHAGASRQTEARDVRRRRSQRRKSRRRLFYGLGGGVIAAALIAGLMLPSVGPLGGSGGGSSTDGTTATSQGTLPSVGTQVAILPGTGSPPTTGTSEAEPAVWGVHDSQVADQAVVRNLERGAVVLNYNLTDEVAVQDLLSFAESQPGFPGCFVMQPYDGVEPGSVTLTSWGWLQNYAATDKAGMQGFIQDHRNSGLQYIDNTCGSGVELSAEPPVSQGG